VTFAGYGAMVTTNGSETSKPARQLADEPCRATQQTGIVNIRYTRDCTLHRCLEGGGAGGIKDGTYLGGKSMIESW